MLQDYRALEQQAEELLKIAKTQKGQARRRGSDDPWRKFDIMHQRVDLDAFEYRAMPEKKRVPWEQDDVPATCWIRSSHNDNAPTLVGITMPGGVVIHLIGGPMEISYEELRDHWIHSTRPQLKNNEWLPCSKEVEG